MSDDLNLTMPAFLLCYHCFFVSSSSAKGLSGSIIFYKVLEITEDADVGKLLAISIRVQGQEEGPFESQEAPHTGEI